jgi:hypothetical protein
MDYNQHISFDINVRVAPLFGPDGEPNYSEYAVFIRNEIYRIGINYYNISTNIAFEFFQLTSNANIKEA